MEKFLTGILFIILLLNVNACSSGSSSPSHPVPLFPETPLEITAYAVKKADYFIRLTFDLADSYLYNNSVAAERYGLDSRYVESLYFNSARTNGEISSSALGGFKFWYYRDDEWGSHVYNVKVQGEDYSGLTVAAPNTIKRNQIHASAHAGNIPAKRFDITYTYPDSPAPVSFDVWYSSEGYSTRYGATLGKDANSHPSVQFSVMDSSNTYHTFTVSFNDVYGIISRGGEGYVESPAAQFIIQRGNITITGNTGYTASYSYTPDDKASGTITGPDSFVADLYMNETGKYDLYYVDRADPLHRKFFIGWNYP